MNYLWEQFNIKTFPAETIVYRDGVFDPSLSTLETDLIDQKYDLPVHIIYVGEIAGNQNLTLDLTVPDQSVFLTVKIKNKLPAFLNILVKNTGQRSVLQGQVLAQNSASLKITIRGHHLAPKTGILIKTKVIAHSKTTTELNGAANIEKGCPECTSDIGFSVLADTSARIEFSPAQYIHAIPDRADHSAAIYRGTSQQIDFLRQAGLSGAEVKEVLEDAFANDFLPF